MYLFAYLPSVFIYHLSAAVFRHYIIQNNCLCCNNHDRKGKEEKREKAKLSVKAATSEASLWE